MGRKIVSILGGFSLLVSAHSFAADQETLSAMGNLYQSLRVLLPLSVNDERFGDPANRQSIETALETVSQGAMLLKNHTQSSDISSRYLAESLQRQAQNALIRFRRDEIRDAKFLVSGLTQVCVACHTKLADPLDAPLSAGFVSEPALSSASASERAQLYLATRQFDPALEALHEILSNPLASSSDLLQAAINYLVVSLRVKSDFDRSVSELARLLDREDIWVSFREDIESWLIALHRFRDQGIPEVSLDAARALIDEARQSAIVPYSLQPLVQYIVASRILQEYISQGRRAPHELSEAYYLLGVTEYGIGYRHWLEQPEHYLTNAILVAPDSPFASRAYRLLEEQTIFGFSGSSGTHIPPDVASHLKELKTLIETSGS